MTEISLFDVNGFAVAYIATDDENIETVYLWNGQAVCYLQHEEHIYGFNGEHLGWFDSGIVRDNTGCAVGFTRKTCPTVTKVEPVKSVRRVNDVKYAPRVAKFRPIDKAAASPHPLGAFLQAGAKKS